VATNAPRAVFVARETDYELLLARHATREQVRFFLKTRGQDIDEVERRHNRFNDVLKSVRDAVPADWRSALIKRADLDRFLFAPEDVVVAVGQDGLVANVAKYLDGQPVLGVNPDPKLYDGVLVPLAPERVGRLFAPAAEGTAKLQHRAMVEAELDDGQKLLALNEVFIGHRSHQSARYDLDVAGKRETQSSSGIIVSSGTGATGWARSIMEATHTRIALAPEESAIAYFVREPFPSVSTGASLRSGKLVAAQRMIVISRMNDGGTIFADGIEQDHLNFDWGRTMQVRVSARHLNLVVGVADGHDRRK
jgi:NAD kinase